MTITTRTSYSPILKGQGLFCSLSFFKNYIFFIYSILVTFSPLPTPSRSFLPPYLTHFYILFKNKLRKHTSHIRKKVKTKQKAYKYPYPGAVGRQKRAGALTRGHWGYSLNMSVSEYLSLKGQGLGCMFIYNEGKEDRESSYEAEEDVKAGTVSK